MLARYAMYNMQKKKPKKPQQIGRSSLPILPHAMKLPLIIDWTACTVKLEEMCMVLSVFPVSLNINEHVWAPRIQFMPRKLSKHTPALEKTKQS